jgi:hypothetical protein
VKTDVAGRVKNTSLAEDKGLLPVYEAIVNSIQAIKDANERTGRIQIVIARDDKHLLVKQDASAGEILGFDVIDNGIGFTDENFQAFNTADTTYKAERGGKGVGRFLWLVAFEKVEVDSHYKPDKKFAFRRFEFVAEGEGVRNESKGEPTEKKRQTTVRLRGFRTKYREQCPKKSDTIASHIIEHCLEFLIRPDCPEIKLEDAATGDSFNLNELLTKELAEKGKADCVDVHGHQFNVLDVRLFEAHGRNHRVYFCANHRVVKSEKLLDRVPNLARHLNDDTGRSFIYAAYVDGELLDKSANAERTEFSIIEDDSDLLVKQVTWPVIRQKVFESAQAFLAPYTEPVRERTQKRIQEFVAKDGPMYRPILKHIASAIDLIDPEIGDDALDLCLYEAYHGLQVRLRTEGQELLKDQADHDEDFDEFSKRLQDYFDQVSDINKSDLARYVCHRKAILDFLQKTLSLQDGGKYSREDRVHRIIFPRGKTSDEVPFDSHNLWLIDEKLVYHTFLASDKPIRTNPLIETDSRKEPDLLVFDKACAFSPGSDPPFPAIFIVEFKRPMRNDYDERDNPFVQVRQYITDLRSGKAKTLTGRDIPLPDGIPFYCFIVADITSSLEQQAYDFELSKTPDAMGFFGFKKQYNAFVQVVSYTKVLTDAKQRNAAFFNKLGLPDRPTRT